MSIFFFFLAVLLTFVSCQSQNLTPINDGCVCPGDELRLNCTTVGGGITIWTGTAFSQVGCNGAISLPHTDFLNLIAGNVSRFCPDSPPAINATALSIIDNSYTSQLIVLKDRMDLNGSTIVCQHDEGTLITTIGTYTIVYTTGEREGEKERERERERQGEKERERERERRREGETGREGERGRGERGEGGWGERETYFCLRFIEIFPSSN